MFINIAVPGPNTQANSRALVFTFIYTAALDFTDEVSSQEVVAEILRHVDAVFVDSVQDVRPIYFPLVSLTP